MKKILLILASIVALLVGIAFVLMQQGKKSSEVSEVIPSDTSFVSTSTDAESNLFPTTDNISTTSSEGVGQTPPIFLKNNDVTSDNNNPGNFFLGNRFPQNQSDPSPNYVILYSKDNHFFTITLLTEPLNYARSEVEVYLRSVLKISDNEMCRLNYSLAVPDAVNQQYSGRDLKFSFCPESVAL